MEFCDIMRSLKRFSFDSKMGISQIYSATIMSPYGMIEVNKLQKNVYPWEIEIFALFSILSGSEYQFKKFDMSNAHIFNKIVDCIRNYMDPRLQEDTDSISFADRFLVMTALSQFPVQESIHYKLFRYNYFFQFRSDKCDMAQQFRSVFGCPYDDFRKSAFALNFIVSSGLEAKSVLEYLIKHKYQIAFSKLIISRKEFINKQNAVTMNTDDYYYCFKYFAQYPLIEENGFVHMPLPHIIVQASTSSLLFRMTEVIPHLRDLFGKEVLEHYITMIFKNSNDYDEVISEYPYGSPEKRTADVIIRKSNACLMIESKAMVPSKKVRLYNDEEINKIIERTACAVIQLYRNITNCFQVEYYPFDMRIDFEIENIFGVVVLLEDHYVRRNLIYQRVAEKLQISIDSKEYNYICSNIKVLSLYEIESKVFECYNLLSILISSKEQPKKWFDYTLSIEGCEKTGDHILNTFIDETRNDISLLAEEMKTMGIIA